MRRRNFSRERLAMLRSFYTKLFHGSGIFADRLNEVRHLRDSDPAIAEILGFIDAGKHRELCQPVKAGKRP
jgi:UDP-N-acetylglucosamine acyltransferase